MIYQTLFFIGTLGLLAQTVLGFAHGGHGHDAHGSGHSGGHAGHGSHDIGHAGHGHASHGHAHAAHGHAAHDAHGNGEQRGGAGGPSPLWTLFSPLTIFSVCLGAGATGLLVQPHLASALFTALAAAAGGAAFYGLLVKPLWSLIFRFASRPARALAGTVAAPAEAVSRFDEKGRGVVRVNIDGQIVRLLAELEPDDRARGLIVAPGDELVVTTVDGQKNTCRVTRL